MQNTNVCAHILTEMETETETVGFLASVRRAYGENARQLPGVGNREPEVGGAGGEASFLFKSRSA